MFSFIVVAQSATKVVAQSATKVVAQSATKVVAQSATKVVAQSATKVVAQSATIVAYPGLARHRSCREHGGTPVRDGRTGWLPFTEYSFLRQKSTPYFAVSHVILPKDTPALAAGASVGTI
ncbi:hypothetical protein GW866_00950 [bacterium]|nr:hypothetical protein [bacterium]